MANKICANCCNFIDRQVNQGYIFKNAENAVLLAELEKRVKAGTLEKREVQMYLITTEFECQRKEEAK